MKNGDIIRPKEAVSDKNLLLYKLCNDFPLRMYFNLEILRDGNYIEEFSGDVPVDFVIEYIMEHLDEIEFYISIVISPSEQLIKHCGDKSTFNKFIFMPFINKLNKLINIVSYNEYFDIGRVNNITSKIEMMNLLDEVQYKIDRIFERITEKEDEFDSIVTFLYMRIFMILKNRELEYRVSNDSADLTFNKPISMEVYRLRYETVYLLSGLKIIE